MPRVERLDLAVLTLPDWHPEASNRRSAPVYGYVIDHPEGAIVVDTGVGEGNELIDEVYDPRRFSLHEALRACGVEPASVVAIVNSHLHFDHCGQNPAFYGSELPVFVQQAELDAVENDPLYTDPAWAVPPPRQKRPLHGDLEIAEGVTLLRTPGHTSGHQSVVVSAGGDRVVIAAQAAWHASEYVDEIATASNVTVAGMEAEALDSIRRIKALKPRVVHFSHCAAYVTDSADEDLAEG